MTLISKQKLANILPTQSSDNGASDVVEVTLLESVKRATTTRLRNSVENVDGITAEEEEHIERGGAFALRATKRKILRWGCYATFAAACVIGLIIIVGIAAMVAYYVYEAAIKGSLGDVISNILNFFYGVAATLAAELLIKKLTKKE